MWVLICFSILSVGLYGVVSSRIKVTEVMTHRIIGQYLAKAACAYFKVTRSSDKTPSLDTLAELNEAQEQELGRGKFKYILKDEDSKININKAPLSMISRLPGFSPDAAKNVFESKLKPFHVVEELLLVEGITDDIFNNCKDLITVYDTGGVNINTAPPAVLKVFGLDDNLITLIGNFRAGYDSKEGTADDGVFKGTGELSLLKESSKVIPNLNMLTVSSKIFSLQIETTVLGKPAMRYNIIMEKIKEKWKIRRWIEM